MWCHCTLLEHQCGVIVLSLTTLGSTFSSISWWVGYARTCLPKSISADPQLASTASSVNET